MIQWRRVSDTPFVTHCPIALRLLDEFTGRPPSGKVSLELDIQNGAGWRPTEIRNTITPGGLFTYPGLGRSADPAADPMRRYRVRISADHYRPVYRVNSDGLEFNVPSYHDTAPPPPNPTMPQTILLLPTANYPFPAYLRVMHGRVRDAGNQPLADALVSANGLERVLTDSNGAFSLPLRWQAPNAVVTVVAQHMRTGLDNTVNLPLPAALSSNQEIVVT